MPHIHRYTRTNIARENKDPVWVMKCNLPRCNSYTFMKTHDSCPQLWGKLSLCNKCGNEFLLNAKLLLLARPVCHKCSAKGREKINAVERLLRNLGKEFEDEFGT